MVSGKAVRGHGQ